MTVAMSREELLEIYVWVGPFCEGMAAVNDGSTWFHIHPNGMPSYEERHDWAGPFSKGVAVINKNDVWFLIRPNGSKLDLTLSPS